MTVEHINPVHSVQNLNKNGSLSKKKELEKTDAVSLSSEAVQKSEQFHAEEAVKSSPDIRADKVAEAKIRLEQLPDNQDILEVVAQKIMKVFGL